jgi:16S rRNA (uracil1498-N3)-methyltransferase
LQAIGKSDHIDVICQKATELGADGIFLFNSERTQTPLKGSRIEKKLNHWRSICISACEQCGRNLLPRVEFCESALDAIENHSLSNRLVLDFNGEGLASRLNAIEQGNSFSVAVGSEGGFNQDEVALFNQHGYLSCLAGPRVLRMETAAISIISTLQYQFGDMG